MSRIQEIHQRLVSRDCSCAELTAHYLQTIEQHQSVLNAYITVTPDEALASARAVDQAIARGESIGLLTGVPMTLKDNLSTAGVRTTCGSKMLEQYRPIYDATVWSLLKEQGAVLLGKTNMDEFAMGSTNATSYFGGVRNPVDATRVAGGSSGGGAAAVGADMAVYSLGTDTGGSIRQPAAFCGVVGLKPTYGAVSRYGLIAYASSFDQIGPIAACVEDAAIVAEAICRQDERDATSKPYVGGSLTAHLYNGVRGLRIGVDDRWLSSTDPAVSSAMDDVLAVYRAAGATLVPVDLSGMQDTLAAYYVLSCAEASSNLGRYDGIRYGYRADGSHPDEAIRRTRSEGFGAEVQRRILLGTHVLSAGYYDAYYQKAQAMRGVVAAIFAQLWDVCDVVLTPTTATTAFRADRLDAPAVLAADRFTVPANMAGLPALSVPCGFDPTGLPIGFQLIGPAFGEAVLLRAGYAFERAVERGMTV